MSNEILNLKCSHIKHPDAKSLQSCPTLSDPIDGSPPGFPIAGMAPGKNTRVGCHFLLQCKASLKRSAEFRMMEGKMGDWEELKFRAYVVSLCTRNSIIPNCLYHEISWKIYKICIYAYLCLKGPCSVRLGFFFFFILIPAILERQGGDL